MLSHHIFSPNTSGPVLRVPVIYRYAKPNAGNNAMYPAKGSRSTGRFLHNNTNNVREPMQPTKKSNIRFVIVFIIITHYNFFYFLNIDWKSFSS